MQHGDLETWSRARILLILEGALASVTPIIEKHWGRTRVTGHTIGWHDTALKRLAVNCRRYPDVGFCIVTFLGDDVRDEAADFLAAIPIDVESVEALDYRRFCDTLRFQSDIQQIIDTDPNRMHNYGQLGRQVVTGGDWG